MLSEEEKKERKKIVQNKWRAKNREHIKEYEHEYNKKRYANLTDEERKKLSEKASKRRKNHLEEHNESTKRWRKRQGNNPEASILRRKREKKYRDEHADEIKAYQKEYYTDNKEGISERKKRTRITNQSNASRAVFDAIENGELVRPDVCPECGLSDYGIEAHHHKGYAKKYWLDIVWLCKSCHMQAHATENRIKQVTCL